MLSGKTAVVTGATSGIGAVTRAARARLARPNARGEIQLWEDRMIKLKGKFTALVAAATLAAPAAATAEEFINIAENSLETVESELRIMKVRYEAGGALREFIAVFTGNGILGLFVPVIIVLAAGHAVHIVQADVEPYR